MKNRANVAHFLGNHPGIAHLLLHYVHHRKKSGKGMAGSGFTHWIKNLGKHAEKLGKKALSGAKTLYKYTNGLPATVAEAVAKKAFGVNLNKYKTWKDAKFAYGVIAGDPSKYEMAYKALKNPKKAIEKATQYVMPAALGFATGGPTGAARNVAATRLREDIAEDLDTLDGEGLRLSGQGKHYRHNPWKSALAWKGKNPLIARQIRAAVRQSGGRLSKKAKRDLLATLGVLGSAGAAGLIGYYSDRKSSMPKPGKINPGLSHQAEWDSDYGVDTTATEADVWGAGMLPINQKRRKAMPKDAKEFVRKHPELARKIREHLNKSGSGLGLSGGKLSKGTKALLATLGIAGVAGAAAYAGHKWDQYKHNKAIDDKWEAKRADYKKRIPMKPLLDTESYAKRNAKIEAQRKELARKAQATKDKKLVKETLDRRRKSGKAIKNVRDDYLSRLAAKNKAKQLAAKKKRGAGKMEQNDDSMVAGDAAGDGLRLAGQRYTGHRGGKLSKKALKAILGTVGALGVAGAAGFASKYARSKGYVGKTTDKHKLGDIFDHEAYARDQQGFGNNPFMKANRKLAKAIMRAVDKHHGKGLRLAGSGIEHGGHGLKLSGNGIEHGGQGLGVAGGRIKARGSKADVYHGRAKKTAGGLCKSDLIVNKRGKVVSKKQSENGKKRIHHLRRK